ncbi:MAG: ATP synthase F1 subunit gamma, partial [Clostridia bacterium]|nr:ATP synthase F1 subunit gamma [Clostridia bacterium]
MGADIKKLRNRIKSVDSTLHLTKAMGLVASSKMRRANEAMLRGREYEKAILQAIAPLINSEECKQSPYMKQNPEGKTCLVVIAGDRGLAGGYNANIFRAMREYSDAEIIPVGKRACDRFKGELRYAEKFTYGEAQEISAELCRRFAKGELARVGILYTKYVSMLTQEAQVRWLLPLSAEENASVVSPVFEPDELTVLNAAVPEYVAGVLVSAARESFASEVAARRCAMDSAGKNAQKMIDGLQREYNRERQ